MLSHYAAGSAVDGCGPSWGGCTEGLRADIEAALQAGGGPALSVREAPLMRVLPRGFFAFIMQLLCRCRCLV